MKEEPVNLCMLWHGAHQSLLKSRCRCSPTPRWLNFEIAILITIFPCVFRSALGWKWCSRSNPALSLAANCSKLFTSHRVYRAQGDIKPQTCNCVYPEDTTAVSLAWQMYFLSKWPCGTYAHEGSKPMAHNSSRVLWGSGASTGISERLHILPNGLHTNSGSDQDLNIITLHRDPYIWFESGSSTIIILNIISVVMNIIILSSISTEPCNQGS